MSYVIYGVNRCTSNSWASWCWQICYLVQDSFSFWVWPWFILLVFIGSFFTAILAFSARSSPGITYLLCLESAMSEGSGEKERESLSRPKDNIPGMGPEPTILNRKEVTASASPQCPLTRTLR